ncbi:hypothetical protein [Streptomyces sp. NBC_00370]|uniref:hypothetical protein n=1 Tax=Streptomyces sp. NBC_00370 TaxID=2975728 RepID=UPI002E260FE0
MSAHWNDTLSTIGGLAGAAAAVAAWRAATKANATADTVARIERDRHHAELAPQFDIGFVETSETRAKLAIHLSGPDQLGHLTSITASVGNDDAEHVLASPGLDVTQEGVDAFVWGPFRFQPDADGADRNGRAVAPVSLLVGRGRSFAMERTRPGHWMTGKTFERWQENYRNEPVRLILTCRRDDEEWVVTRRIPNPPL